MKWNVFSQLLQSLISYMHTNVTRENWKNLCYPLQGYKGSKGDMGMPGASGDKGATGFPGLPVRDTKTSLASSPQPHLSHESRPSLGYQWGQRWQRRPRSSWPPGSFSELQRGRFYKHLIFKIMCLENVGVFLLVQHLSSIFADHWPPGTSRAPWTPRTNGEGWLDRSENHKTLWLKVINGSKKATILGHAGISLTRYLISSTQFVLYIAEMKETFISNTQNTLSKQKSSGEDIKLTSRHLKSASLSWLDLNWEGGDG